MRDNDVVFFNLHRRYLNSSPQFGGFLGIFSLAAFLNSNGFRAQSYAGQMQEGLELIDEVCLNHQVGLIGLYCDYENVTEVINLSSYIKDTYHIPVIVGGPQATSLSKNFYKESKCDAVVRYEGELTVLDLANLYIEELGSLEEIKGISFLKGETLIIQEEQELIENLDALPFITDECYLVPKTDISELSIMTGRGCPFHCSFCHEGHHTRKVRLRSVDNVLDEIRIYLQEHPYLKKLHVLFTDDTFTLLPERVKALCSGIEELQKIKPFKWFCEGHVHTLYLHPEMIGYIAQAGAQRIQLGIEAGSQVVLDAYQKGSTLDEIRFVVRECYQQGIEEIYSNIILAGANFNQQVYKENIDFAKELLDLAPGVMEIGVVSYWPLPETTITNYPEKFGLMILDYDFLTSSGDFPQVETKEFSRWDLVAMMQDMEKEISSYMKKLLLSHKVDSKLIISWVTRTHTKYVGRWIYVLSQLPHVLNYYSMLASKECFETNCVECLDLAIHPMRTIPLAKYIKQDRMHTSIMGYNLSDIEIDVLVYSLGKLSIADIITLLNDKYRLDVSIQDVVYEALWQLSDRYLIVWSKQ